MNSGNIGRILGQVLVKCKHQGFQQVQRWWVVIKKPEAHGVLRTKDVCLVSSFRTSESSVDRNCNWCQLVAVNWNWKTVLVINVLSMCCQCGINVVN